MDADRSVATVSGTELIDGRRGPLEVQSAARPACFHCGEPCSDGSPAKDDRAFCCPGCLAVHELLAESGLGHFYELGAAPGVRIRSSTATARWVHLDNPDVQARLLDFTDGNLARITFRVPAIHCVACVWLLENLFRLHPGVGRSQVDFAKREVTIDFSLKRLQLSELAALLARIGYEPVFTLEELEKRLPDPSRRRRWLQVGVAGFAFGNIMLMSLPQYLGLDSFSGPRFRLVFGYLSLALALPVFFYSAADYWRSAALSVRQRVLSLDVPIALGLTALYSQSAWEILSGSGHGYLDSLTGLVFFLLCGRVFQHVTQDRLAFDHNYRSFFPLSVTRKLPASNQEERVSISQLVVGDRVLVRHGELVPADSILRSGPALVDYSYVTGESDPVAKPAGAYLYAGGRHMGGTIELETVKPVSQSYLASLWNHETFRKDRGRSFQTLTNRFSRYFTPAVISLAIGSAAFWLGSGNATGALKAFIAVLIVACPCALALAAPFTLGTVQRWLARASVFLRNTFVLERMARVDTIVFDKTGTLTASGTNAVSFWSGGSARTESRAALPAVLSGQPAVGGAESGLGDLEAEWVGALARHSTHPHAARISQALAHKSSPATVVSFSETPGCGIKGQVCGHVIRLGSFQWLESCGVDLQGEADPDTSAPAARRTAHDFGSVVGVAIDGQYRGAFQLANALRPEVEGLIQRLCGRYNLALLSGDQEKDQERFQVIFPHGSPLHFQQSPLEKLGFIERLQQSGKIVMMVGDGLNDAGALRQSDVGVAVVDQVGGFSPASDVILEAGQIPRLIDVLNLARRAVRIVRWGFTLSAAYNLAGVTVAAAGHLSPLVAAILMPLSSLSVVLFACGAATRAARKAGLAERALREVR